MSVLGDKLSEKYEKVKKRKGYKSNESDDSDEDEEKALFVKTFNEICHKRGKIGHKTVECRSRGGHRDNRNIKRGGGMSNGHTRFKGKCHHYSKYGHKDLDCCGKY